MTTLPSFISKFLNLKPQETEVANGRLPAHKDLSFATIVHQIDVGGLQQRRDKSLQPSSSRNWGKIIGLLTSNNGVIQVPKEMVDDKHPLLYNPFDHPAFICFFINANMAIKANNPTKAFCCVRPPQT
nr:uncharacterized protein LOC125422387 [Ziziphus jujuba var. spinosa]